MPEETELKEEKERAAEEQDTNPPGRFDFFWKTPVAIALVCLMILGILLPFRIIPRTISGFTSTIQKYLSRPTPPLSVNKSALSSGDFVTLNLNSATTSPLAETYVLTYPCRPGISLDYSQSGTDYDRTKIECETPFTFNSKNKQITLRVISQATTSVEQPISVDISPGTGTTTSTEKIHLGEVSLFVLAPQDSSEDSSTNVPSSDFWYPSPTATSTSTTTAIIPDSSTWDHVQQPSVVAVRPPDLTIQLLKIGKNVNGVITETRTFNTYDPIVVQFSIQNIGGTSRGGWKFEMTAPTIDPAKRLTYSPAQPALTTGSGSTNTLTIGGLIPGNQTISITLDQASVSGDVNLSNNKIDIPITIY